MRLRLVFFVSTLSLLVGVLLGFVLAKGIESRDSSRDPSLTVQPGGEVSAPGDSKVEAGIAPTEECALILTPEADPSRSAPAAPPSATNSPKIEPVVFPPLSPLRPVRVSVKLPDGSNATWARIYYRRTVLLRPTTAPSQPLTKSDRLAYVTDSSLELKMLPGNYEMTAELREPDPTCETETVRFLVGEEEGQSVTIHISRVPNIHVTVVDESLGVLNDRDICFGCFVWSAAEKPNEMQIIQLARSGIADSLKVRPAGQGAFVVIPSAHGQYLVAGGRGSWTLGTIDAKLVGFESRVPQTKVTLRIPRTPRKCYVSVRLTDPKGALLTEGVSFGVGYNNGSSSYAGTIRQEDGKFHVWHYELVGVDSNPSNPTWSIVATHGSYGSLSSRYEMTEAPALNLQFSEPAVLRVSLADVPDQVDLAALTFSVYGNGPFKKGTLKELFTIEGSQQVAQFGPYQPGKVYLYLAVKGANEQEYSLIDEYVEVIVGHNTTRLVIPPLYPLTIHLPRSIPGTRVSFRKLSSGASTGPDYYSLGRSGYSEPTGQDSSVQIPWLPSGTYLITCKDEALDYGDGVQVEIPKERAVTLLPR